MIFEVRFDVTKIFCTVTVVVSSFHVALDNLKAAFLAQGILLDLIAFHHALLRLRMVLQHC